MTKPPAADLSDLLARVAARDREAFAAVYKATSAKLWGIVVRILPRRAMAEDVLQDVYVRIWERAATFDPAKASPITWMATIARNRAIDEVRRRTPVSIEDAPEALEVAEEGLNPLTRRRAEPGRCAACRSVCRGSTRSGARSCCSPTTTGSAATSWRSASPTPWQPSRPGCTAAWRN